MPSKKQNFPIKDYSDVENLELIGNIIDNLSQKLKHSNEFFISELEKLPTNKANPQLVENLVIERENKPIKYIARVTVTQSTIKIQPYNKQNVNSILELIQKTFTESQVKNDDENVWVTLPALSEDLKDRVKSTVKGLLLNIKNKQRILRQDAMNVLKAAKDRLSDDLYHRKLLEIDEIVKKMYKQAEKNCQDKVNSIV